MWTTSGPSRAASVYRKFFSMPRDEALLVTNDPAAAIAPKPSPAESAILGPCDDAEDAGL